MKVTINKYFYLVIVLLLNTFAGIFSNQIISKENNGFIEFNSKALHATHKTAAKQNKITATYKPYSKQEQHDLLFDFIEVNEVEEEAPTSKKSIDLYFANNAFIVSQVFETFSKEHQKRATHNTYTFNKPATRLHVQYQVFII